MGFLAARLPAQDINGALSNNVPSPPAVEPTVTERGGNSRTWARVVPLGTNEQGQAVYATNSEFTELATGMHHLVNNQWVESAEEIQITQNGGQAINGQHQVAFAANINTSGSIDVTMSDGQHLKSHLFAISYYDTSLRSNVLIALPKDSIGQVFNSNQVIYTNAFLNVVADARYTYTRGGFEQDLILRQQLPAPEAYGLNSANTRLQLWTEFVAAPTPEITQATVDGDQYLNFGPMQMGAGRAFLFGNQSDSVPVRKYWTVTQGRNCLLEEIDFPSIAQQLLTLPPYSGGTNGGGGGEARLYPRFPAELPPAPKMAQEGSGGLKLATTSFDHPGLVLDYQAVNSATNFTFQGDQTYFVSGAVTLSSNTTLEGGAVIKFANTNNAGITLNGPLISKTGPYRPAVLTSKNDNSVGGTISGSTGSPDNTNGVSYFIGGSGQTSNYQYLRILFAGIGITNAGIVNVWNSQFWKCGTAVANDGTGAVNLYNALITQGTNCVYTTNAVVAVNITGDQVQNFCATTNFTGANVTNSIIAGVTNQTGVSTVCSVTNGSGLFQAVAGGNYYLAAGSPNRDIGTPNIPPDLLSNLQARTTYPPIRLTANWSSVAKTNLILSPQAERDTNTLDLGYHYDPLDYVWSNLSISTVTLTLTNGVAVGVYGTNGLSMSTSGGLVSHGSPININHFAPCAVVQEQPLTGINTLINDTGTSPTINFRFTDLPMLGGVGYYIYATETAASAVAFGTLTIRDCSLRGGVLYVLIGSAGSIDDGLFSSMTVAMTNNVLDRCATTFYRYYAYPPAFNLSKYNNLCHGGTLTVHHDAGTAPDTSPPTWHLHDNLFEGVTITYAYSVSAYVVNDHNGFFNATAFSNSGGNDKVRSTADYEAGYLGTFYYPTNGTNLAALIDAGSRNATNATLYHFTTTTNQVKETNTTVDIGFHYISLDGNNQPKDTDGDGVPDYLEDANGNGAVNSGETDWQTATDLGLRVIITKPKSNSILP